MTDPSPRFADSIILVLVGPEKALFKISKQLVCNYSQYFRAALSKSFKEGHNGILRLEDEDPETFEAFAEWLYCGAVLRPDTIAKPDRWNWYLNLYILADRLCAHGLQNQVMDNLIAMAKLNPLSFTATWKAWDRTPPRCKLREFLLDFAAQQALVSPPADVADGDDTVGKDFLAEFGKRSLRTYLPLRRGLGGFATDEPQRCKRYHVHHSHRRRCKDDQAITSLSKSTMDEAGL